jgi:hypothetical protein
MLDNLTALQKIALHDALGKDIKKNKLKESIKPNSAETVKVTVEGESLSFTVSKGEDSEVMGLDSKVNDRLLLHLLAIRKVDLETVKHCPKCDHELSKKKKLHIHVELEKSLAVDTGTHALSGALTTAISDYKGTLPKRTRNGSVRVS